MPKYRGKECTPICNVQDGQGNDFPRDPDDPTQVVVNTVYLDDFAPADGDKGTVVDGCLPIPTPKVPENVAGEPYPVDEMGNPIIDFAYSADFSPTDGTKAPRDADGCVLLPVAAPPMGLVDLEGNPIPTAGNDFVVHNLASVNTAPPCPVGDLEEVYCVGAALYTRPSYNVFSRGANEGGNPDWPGPWEVGDYNLACLTVTNDDPCGRPMQCQYVSSWAGVSFRLVPGGTFGVNFMVAVDGGPFGPHSGVYFGEGVGGLFNIPGTVAIDLLPLAPGQSKTIKIKYEVTVADGATAVSPVAAFSTNITADCSAI